jgi:hypothetical protein
MLNVDLLGETSMQISKCDGEFQQVLQDIRFENPTTATTDSGEIQFLLNEVEKNTRT